MCKWEFSVEWYVWNLDHSGQWFRVNLFQGRKKVCWSPKLHGMIRMQYVWSVWIFPTVIFCPLKSEPIARSNGQAQTCSKDRGKSKNKTRFCSDVWFRCRNADMDETVRRDGNYCGLKNMTDWLITWWSDVSLSILKRSWFKFSTHANELARSVASARKWQI
jgi:hypothetical protein